VEIVILEIREVLHDNCLDELRVPDQNNWLTEFEDTSALVILQLPETAIDSTFQRVPTIVYDIQD
jgi:hypothetical protein